MGQEQDFKPVVDTGLSAYEKTVDNELKCLTKIQSEINQIGVKKGIVLPKEKQNKLQALLAEQLDHLTALSRAIDDIIVPTVLNDTASISEKTNLVSLVQKQISDSNLIAQNDALDNIKDSRIANRLAENIHFEVAAMSHLLGATSEDEKAPYIKELENLQLKNDFFTGRTDHKMQDITRNQKPRELEHVPKNRGVYTEKLEFIIGEMLKGEKYTQKNVDGQNYVIISDQAFNLNHIAQYANFSQLRFNDEEHARYFNMLAGAKTVHAPAILEDPVYQAAESEALKGLKGKERRVKRLEFMDQYFLKTIDQYIQDGQMQDSTLKELSAAERMALNIYTGPFFQPANNFCRKGELNESLPLDELLCTMGLTGSALSRIRDKDANKVTSRGDDDLPDWVYEKRMASVEKGRVVDNPGFTSTRSDKLDPTFGFNKESKTKVGSFIQVAGKYIDPLSQMKGEHEVVSIGDQVVYEGVQKTAEDESIFVARMVETLSDLDPMKMVARADLDKETMSGLAKERSNLIKNKSKMTEDDYALALIQLDKKQHRHIQDIAVVRSVQIAKVEAFEEKLSEREAQAIDGLFDLMLNYNNTLEMNGHTTNSFEETLSKLDSIEQYLPNFSDPEVENFKQQAHKFRQTIEADQLFFTLNADLQKPLSPTEIKENIQKLKPLEGQVGFANRERVSAALQQYHVLAGNDPSIDSGSPDPTPSSIKSDGKTVSPKFAKYVENYCPNITLEQANEYASRGQEFLKQIESCENINKLDRTDKAIANNMSCLQWFLVQQSFENGKQFGKGTFTLTMQDNKHTEILYDYFKDDTYSLFPKKAVKDPTMRSVVSSLLTGVGAITSPINAVANLVNLGKSAPTYSRSSSHFDYDELAKPEDGHFGIDAKHADVPMPWKFKTTCFAETKTRSGKNALYIKPETEGADTLRDFTGTVLHGINFIKAAMGHVDKVEGLDRFAESDISDQQKSEIVAILENFGVPSHLIEQIDLKNYKSIKDSIDQIYADPKNEESIEWPRKDILTELGNHLVDKYNSYNQRGGEVRFEYGPKGLILEGTRRPSRRPSQPQPSAAEIKSSQAIGQDTAAQNTDEVNRDPFHNIQINGQSISELQASGEYIVNLHDATEENPYDSDEQIYIDRVQCIFAAASDLLVNRFADDANAKSRIEQLKEETLEQLRQLDPAKSSDHEKGTQKIFAVTRDLATVLKDAEKQVLAQGKTDKPPEDDWLKTLQAEDYHKISSAPRKPIVNCYPDGSGGYIISYAKPLTNISSLTREGEPRQLPNFWQVKSTHVDQNGAILSERSFFRSSSLCPFEEKDKEKRLEKARDIAQFEMGEYALARLEEKIAKLNPGDKLNDTDIGNCFQFNYFNMSLQSMIGDENQPIQESNKIYKEINEKVLQEGGIALTKEQEARAQAMLAGKMAPETQPNFSVKPKVIFMNLGTNMLRGDDFFGVQKEINHQARKDLQALTHDKLAESKQPGLENILALLKDNNPISASKVKDLKKEMGEVKLSADNQNIMDLFVHFANHTADGQGYALTEHHKNNSINNYVAQESAMALAEELGCTVKVNCQSGKDRTGLACAAVEAAQVLRDRNKSATFDLKEFWKSTLPNAVKYTAGRVITSINCPGAKGIQGQHFPYITPDGFAKAIFAKAQDKASRLHKSPYLVSGRIASHLVTKISNQEKSGTEQAKSLVGDIASQFDSPAATGKFMLKMLAKPLQLFRESLTSGQDQFDDLMSEADQFTPPDSKKAIPVRYPLDDIDELKSLYKAGDDSIKQAILTQIEESLFQETPPENANDLMFFSLSAGEEQAEKEFLQDSQSRQNTAASTPKEIECKALQVAAMISEKMPPTTEDIAKLKDLIALEQFHSGLGDHADKEWVVPNPLKNQFANSIKATSRNAFMGGKSDLSKDCKEALDQYMNENHFS